MKPVGPIGVEAIRAARPRIAGTAIRSPLLPLDVPGAPCELWVKLECLQPISSFKVRGATNALALADPALIARGVYTGSAGNMAQGLALAARRLGVPCRVVVPATAPRNKLDAIARLGATAVPLPFDEWWNVLRDHGHPSEDGHFVHPVSDPAVIAGNGTVGLEIVEDLPDVRAVVVPYGGGGLSCGIAAAVGAVRPGVPVFASEIETAAPFAAALNAGCPVEVGHTHSFVDGIGSTRVLDEMWPLASASLAGSRVVSLEDACTAIRVLFERGRVVAEGAGGTSVAAALKGLPGIGEGPVVAVVSGGNIDAGVLRKILEGRMP
ncbi:MAG: pyridoxal-phosphate dependent enzyme [Gemmatimonadota bacterium]|nr:pyridoxal-phosphate dependent enzyme [Gemmatimonadota bacterium]MDE2983692.1 pyridoxal-phosphate dependent enzyme [Gemmatimonadota bacterium]